MTDAIQARNAVLRSDVALARVRPAGLSLPGRGLGAVRRLSGKSGRGGASAAAGHGVARAGASAGGLQAEIADRDAAAAQALEALGDAGAGVAEAVADAMAVEP